MHDDHDHGGDTLAQLKNLGPGSQKWLLSIGIRNREQLAYVGVPRAYQLIKSQFPEASLNLLWALEGALRGQSWSTLPEEVRQSLLEAVNSLE